MGSIFSRLSPLRGRFYHVCDVKGRHNLIMQGWTKQSAHTCSSTFKHIQAQWFLRQVVPRMPNLITSTPIMSNTCAIIPKMSNTLIN